ALGRDGQTDRQIAPWIYPQLRSIEGGGRNDVRNHGKPPHLGGKLRGHICDRIAVLAADDEGHGAFAGIVEEPVVHIRNIAEIPADRLLELLLRERSLRFWNKIDGQCSFADLDNVRWDPPAVHEHAFHLWPIV